MQPRAANGRYRAARLPAEQGAAASDARTGIGSQWLFLQYGAYLYRYSDRRLFSAY
ncbi:hypothetical protein SODG_002085 [Sodalis praecaptivus]